MNAEERVNLLERIEEIQRNRNGRGTNKVTVQIGRVDDSNIVRGDAIIIQDAPAAVLNDLRDEGYSLSVSEVGVTVRP